MEVPNYGSQLLLLLCFIIYCVASDAENLCAPGLNTYGTTVPRGDIFLEFGESLEIYCLLNQEKRRENGYSYNSSSLYFSYDNQLVRNEFVSIVNETAIKLYMHKPPPFRKMIFCKLQNGSNDVGVCLNYVSVGSKPQPVRNFSCISYNWESMNCSWVPEPNFIKTTYNLTFQLSKNNKNSFPCPGSTENNYCVWNASSKPPHRLAYEYYYFILYAKNALGNLSTRYTVNHYAVVVPHKPINLSLVEATSSSLTITWSLPVALRTFPPGITHKIMYQSKWDPINYWQVIEADSLKGIKNSTMTYNITQLKYAYTLYDIRILMKSANANDDMWSEPATTTLHTKASVPGAPPQTDIGSFEFRNSGPHREVYIYWQQIPKFMENGDNFEYKIVRIQETNEFSTEERNMVPVVATKTYAKFVDLSPFSSYNFTIVSFNKEGYSKGSSSVIVPSSNQKLADPAHFKKMPYHLGVFELSWKIAPEATSYTIFWCDNKHDRPYECKGVLNWTKAIVGQDVFGEDAVFNVTLPVDKVYQFALSANNHASSSGMVWASCTVLPGQAIGKLKNVWINRIGATFIEVSWKLDCIRVIDGFEISYCPIVDPQDSKCTDPVKTFIMKGNSLTSHANITGLKPYTTYMVFVAVVSGNVTGAKSDPLLNTTMEAAPILPPTLLTPAEVTNSSITVSWQPPPSLNGVLRYYLVHWNDNATRVEDRSRVVQITLNGLSSYEWYSIRVQACTNACSPKSSTVKIRTKIGTPGKMTVPSLKYNNSTSEFIVNVEWSPPDYRAGPLSYYDLRLQVSDGNKLLKEKLLIASGDMRIPNASIPIPECQTAGPSQYYTVEVRAVNEAEDGERLIGPWSQPAERNCYPTYSYLNLPTIVLLLVVGVLALLAICIAFGYILRCLWLRCKKMQNVGVKLPAQLELNNVFRDKIVVDMNKAPHVSQNKPTTDAIGVPPPDQQRLLDKKDKEELVESSMEDCEEGVNNDRESSGCGSGHDSVSSSITAGTHITDSGTEADELPGSSDVFSESLQRHGSDLRQRNNVVPNGISGEGYSRLAPAPTSPGYVAVAPVTARGYVSHPHLWIQGGSPSKGYVAVGPAHSNNSAMEI